MDISHLDNYLKSSGYQYVFYIDDMETIYTKDNVETRVWFGVKGILNFDLKIDGTNILTDYHGNPNSVEKLMNYLKQHNRKTTIKELISNKILDV